MKIQQFVDTVHCFRSKFTKRYNIWVVLVPYVSKQLCSLTRCQPKERLEMYRGPGSCGVYNYYLYQKNT